MENVIKTFYYFIRLGGGWVVGWITEADKKGT